MQYVVCVELRIVLSNNRGERRLRVHSAVSGTPTVLLVGSTTNIGGRNAYITSSATVSGDCRVLVADIAQLTARRIRCTSE